MPELPLRVVDQPGGAVIVCLCGAELSALRRSSTELRGLRSSVRLLHLSPDLTPAGLMIMVVHAKRCAAGHARLAALNRKIP